MTQKMHDHSNYDDWLDEVDDDILDDDEDYFDYYLKCEEAEFEKFQGRCKDK